MKVGGPTQIPTAEPSPAEGAKTVAEADGATTSEAATGTKLSERVDSLTPGREVPVSDIARQVTSGNLSPQLALEQVMDRVLGRQLDPTASSGVREQVRTALLDALENDPLLAEKLRQLG